MRRSAAAIGAALLAAAGGQAKAAEGGSSHYLPGAAGDMLLALPPSPGLTVANTLWFQNGSEGRAVLEGVVRVDLDISILLNLAAASYTFDKEAFGGRFTVAAVVPFGYADLDARLAGPAGGTVSAGGSDFALSDVALVPLQWNTSVDKFSFKLSQSIIAPTGSYSLSRAVNLGRNYWSFDTNAAVTWFDPGKGREISLAPGVMFNTENDATNYRTGTEFHMDFTATQFLSPSFGLGLRGYWYQQLTGDSGSGARLGSFKSRSVALGLGVSYTPAAYEGRLAILGKIMRDIDADNRFESTYGTLTAAWTF